MDAILATVTVISLSMAFAMGIVTWRLMREERRRADARVAVLMADLSDHGDYGDNGDNPAAVAYLDSSADLATMPVRQQPRRPREPDIDLAGRTALGTPHLAPRVRLTESATPRRRSALARGAVPMRSTNAADRPPVVAVAPPVLGAPLPTELFSPIGGASASLRPFLATVAAVVVVMAAVSFTMLFRLPGGAPPNPGTGATPAVELLSLAHARQGGYLAITGSIRNPSDGIERGHLSVTAIVFDNDGGVVGTGQTPLPVSVLSPGSETLFTISLPNAERINRYRISFMQGPDSVPHVDRRRPNDLARAAMLAPTGDRP